MFDEEKRTFRSMTLGLPPLKMVLVNAENDRHRSCREHDGARRQNESARTILEAPEIVEKRKKQKMVAKIIKHLNEKSITYYVKNNDHTCPPS